MAKQDVLIELFYSGAWQDVTSKVYVRDGITITRGRADETSQPSPTQASLTFDNRDGTYNPENPASSLYGLIGRNTPIRITVAGDVRFSGEVASWDPKRAIDDGDAWTLVTAAGVTRRLEQGADPLKSALRRFIEDQQSTTDLIGYWPMDEGPSAKMAMPALGGSEGGQPGGPLRPEVGLFQSSLKFGEQRPAPWLDTGCLMDNDTTAYARVVGMAVQQFRYVVDVVRSQPDTVNTTIAIDGNTDGKGVEFNINFLASGSEIWVSMFEEGLISADSPTQVTGVTQAFDGTMRHIRFEAFQDGSTISWLVYVDNQAVAFNTESGTHGLTGISEVALTRAAAPLGSDPAGPVVWGHLGIWHGDAVPDLGEAKDAAYGHPFEAAGRRAERLASEEGVAFTAVGDLDDTAPLGPQHPETLPAVLDEAGKADLGFVTDSRPALGILNRSRVSLYNQAPVLELDFAAEEVAPPLDPVIDDQATRNDVTVTRRDGASRRETLDTGPMSTLPPPNGVGRYNTSVTVNVAADGHLIDQGGWRLHLGTVKGTRYPQLTVDLDAVPALAAAVAAVDLGDRITIANLPASFSPDLASLIAQGYTETIRSHRRLITFNNTPERPWVVGRYAALVEGFEDAALDVTIGQGTSDLPWVRTDSLAYIGRQSLRSGAITDAQTSDAVVTVPAGATTVRFFYRVDTEATFDHFRFLIDGVQQFEASGNVDWTESAEFDVSAATTVTFRFIKDASVGHGTDAVYVDQLVFGELAPGPAEPSRYSPVDSTTTAAFTSGTDTALTVEDNTGDRDLWSTTADVPFDIRVAGVRLRVTAVGALAAGVQTLTVDQVPVNGVAKTIPAGSQVELWQPAVYAL